MSPRLLASLISAASLSGLALAGPLTPPIGPVASTHKTLTEVEPRTIINSTNTPGDADSVYKITQPGSYYLTANVTGAVGRHGIEIASSGVTIDLNGFAVIGAIGMGAFDGIGVTAGGLSGITVKNGSVRNWGDEGIDFSTFAASGCSVSDVTASGNVGAGISVFTSSSVHNCLASSNGSDGIQTSFGCSITNCIAASNGGDGISGSVANAISNCTAYLNVVDGIGVGSAGVITQCASYDNTARGFTVGSNGLIDRSVASANGDRGIEGFFASVVTNCVSSNNTSHGIVGQDRCTITFNTCVRNGLSAAVASGILIEGDTGRIEGNTCTENDYGIEITGTRNLVVRSTCSGNFLANWNIAANNVVGPILNRTAPASAAILGDVAPSSLGSTDANANYTR